jgi:hypothetical protein
MIPAPGRVLLRPIETESSIGRIQLLDSTRENMTPNQYEVVAVGPRGRCVDPDECDRPHHCFDLAEYDASIPPLGGYANTYHPTDCAVNDWVLVRHRAVAPTDDDNLFIAWQDDILAILSLNGTGNV